eukprot:gnl/MRDRNA2_/MRDRNA2_109584_c0_seq1.p1 gnl/MRDRNA2_/MRDRNA2_109584_c0~~gnl/MRDRNA2_/MRDRNA2_109584_c0_seq1.p1  ORF type:complete len:534 (-),score=131.55 gnl/MRDRNA2_/MRDRNA2_109584_c0_seq1:159-1760(-)
MGKNKVPIKRCMTASAIKDIVVSEPCSSEFQATHDWIKRREHHQIDAHHHRNDYYHLQARDPLLKKMNLRSWKDECHCEDLLLKYPIPIVNSGLWRGQKKLNRPSSAPGLSGAVSMIEALQRPKATGDLVKRLLSAKASVRERDSKNDKTPLHIAVRTNNVGACQAILDAAMLLQPPSRFKEVLEAQDLLGLTPLMEAASAGFLDVIEELLKRGALVSTAVSSVGSTALDCAYQGGNVEVIALVGKHAKLQKDLEHAQKMQNRDQWTTLMHAAQTGDQTSIKSAVAGGNKAWEPGFMNDTPLHIAARHGKVSAVQTLLQVKAFVNSKNDARLTPLSCAVAAGNVSVIKILVKARADIRKEDHELVASRAIKDESKGESKAIEIAEALTPAGMGRSTIGTPGRRTALMDIRNTICGDLSMNAQDKDAALAELENFEKFLSSKMGQADVSSKRQNQRVSVRFNTIHATLQRAFKKFDETKNNEVSKTEFMKGMQSLGYKGQTAKLFTILDLDKSGSISLREIMEAAETLAFADTS